MDICSLKRFFMWCTVLNMGVMLFVFLAWVTSADAIYRLHSRWFSVERRTFNTVFYSFFGLYEMGVFFFNIVPLAALVIIS